MSEACFNLQFPTGSYFTQNPLSRPHPTSIQTLPISTFFNIDIDSDLCLFSLFVFSLLALFVQFDDVQIGFVPEEKHVE